MPTRRSQVRSPREPSLRGLVVGMCLGLVACVAPRSVAPAGESTGTGPVAHVSTDGRVRSRPGPVSDVSAAVGEQPLGLGGARDGLVYVPRTYRPEQPAPLMLLLHGAKGNARQMLQALAPVAESEGFLLVIPESRGVTWDHKLATGGADLDFIDMALARVFSRYAVAPERVSVSGFSDGASYALSLGILNGDVFSRIVAFAPGFVDAAEPRGVPRVFIAHGDADQAIPVEEGRRIGAELRSAGFDVRFHEFTGGHSIPADVAQAAARWLREPNPPADSPASGSVP
ncbi:MULTISPECIES: alpha/beta hydrolase [Myxococcus]|uniref:alpha/beta hydrolase n=1 Tax=Myxococcus TaxID=32 RepID=UPI001E4E5918|nr:MULTISPECIES: alpha/beta hydrolase-fold protein [Myxococcus]MCK8502795.1 alpha/beta hydrolase-fold protein [Myxococcus fulvus]